ncbi:DUF3558 domain-containing protein [Nocardia abscessus]|uniref:DUF3558 domain-containing protein n=1 Tax=Nocardia abscessus TaxID=120957 RepID=UPI0009FCE327|nr:DUF3558 domain-containing protein [Nocardia abscessus]MCC3333406.1 DUF3558 domain-containing protein [Nocardia abscessus]
MKRALVCVWGIALSAFVAACSPSGDSVEHSTSSAATSTAIRIAVPVNPAPAQNDQWRNAVRFDPCAGIGDDTISTAGFDPSTRKRNDFSFDTYSFIGCSFDHKESIRGQMLPVRTLTVWSTNISLAEFRDRYAKSSEKIVVDGRDALRYRQTEVHSGSCGVAMKTADGALDVSTSTNAAFTSEKPCDRIVEVASAIESVLPEG